MLLRSSFDPAAVTTSIPSRMERPTEDAASLRALFRCQKLTPFEARKVLFREGDRADAVFLIVSGLVRTYRFFPNGRRVLARFLFPGDIVGLEFGDVYPFTAEAIRDVGCYRLTVRQLELLCKHSTALQSDLVTSLRRQIAVGDDEILPLKHQNADARVARLLSILARHGGCSLRNGARIELAMSRADIADFVGLTIETVCRTFSKLKNDGLISLPTPDDVQVLNAPRLLALAEEED
jgi:CRP-like cAMP-binding protein